MEIIVPSKFTIGMETEQFNVHLKPAPLFKYTFCSLSALHFGNNNIYGASDNINYLIFLSISKSWLK